MTEVTIPSVDEFTLNVEDWDIACEIRNGWHKRSGTGAAEWAFWWRFNHEHCPPFQYACTGCHDALLAAPQPIIRCPTCNEVWPGPIRSYVARVERIKP